MSKFLQILLVACFAAALCAAEAPRRGATRFQPAAPRRSRVLARQEEAPAAVTPYPSAAELKPEVAFDEVEQSAQAPAAEDAAPEHQPDQTYGPPEIETDEEPLAEEEPAVAADVPVDAEEAAPAVDDVEQAEAAAEEEAAAAAEEEAVQSERLVFGRRIGARRSARPAKLRAAPKMRSARVQEQPQFVAQPMFYYQPW